MKILITGANGYLIRNLKACFIGHEKCFLVRKRNEAHKALPLVVEADIRNFSSVQQVIDDFSPDVILHAAAKISISRCDIEDSEMYETNVVGTRNIMKSAHSDSTIIYISSMTVYSEDNPIPVDENAVCIPPHFYGFTKLLGEQIVRYYGNCRNVNHLILRLPGIYGGDRKNGYIYNTIMKASKNADIIVDSKGLIYWQAISVDIIDKTFEYIFKMIENKPFRDTFNVCHGEDTDFVETAQYIAKTLNSDSKVIIKRPIGYRKFPLSNARLVATLRINPITPYFESLKQYIEALQTCES